MSALNTAGEVRQGQPSGRGRGRADRGGRGGWSRGVGSRGGGVARNNGVQRLREQTVQIIPTPIEISTDSDESEEEEEDDDQFGFGRCFRCGESDRNHPCSSLIFSFR